MEITRMNDRLLCRMPSRLDTATCVEIHDPVLLRVREENLPVVFDLKDVTFVCSMFLRLCLQAYELSGPGRFQVANLSPDVKKVFKIAGLDMISAGT
jgi:anti-anti-sigma factor